MNMFATSEDRTLGATICGCETTPERGCDQELPETTLATLMFLEPSDVATVNTCIQTMGCSQQAQCIDASPLMQAFACPQ